jgi:hypothetical protein
VGVGGDAVRQPGELVDDVRRERRVGGVVRVHVADAQALHLRREPRGLRHDDERPQQEARGAQVAGDGARPGAGVGPRAASQPVQLGGQEARAERRVVRAGHERGGFGVAHRVVLALEGEHLHPQAEALEPEYLVQDEGLGDLREPRHQMSDSL